MAEGCVQCLLPAPEVLSAAGDDFILLSCLPQISGSGSVLPRHSYPSSRIAPGRIAELAEQHRASPWQCVVPAATAGGGHRCCGDTVPFSAGVAAALRGCCWLHVHPTQVWRPSCEQQSCFCADYHLSSTTATFLSCRPPPLAAASDPAHACSFAALHSLHAGLPVMGPQEKQLVDTVLWVQALWRLRASFCLLIAVCSDSVLVSYCGSGWPHQDLLQSLVLSPELVRNKMCRACWKFSSCCDSRLTKFTTSKSHVHSCVI